jgi:hypothetical protein
MILIRRQMGVNGKRERMNTMRVYRKPAAVFWTGALTAASLLVSPVAAANPGSQPNAKPAQEQNAVPVPIPAQVSKGIQHLVRLVPELASRFVVYTGPVDGPGVSGEAVTFAFTRNGAEESGDMAVFDPQTGNLLSMEIAPEQTNSTAVLGDQQVIAKASAFLSRLHPHGLSYHPRAVTRQGELRTVRFVRKINNIPLDDGYDCFVTVDKSGRIVGFRTFDGALYQKWSPASFPSAQRIMSRTTANQRYAQSRPLEPVYLLPSQYDGRAPVDARLVYAIRDGVVRHPHSGSALDAVKGSRLTASRQQAEVRTLTLTGTGEAWAALTEAEAQELVKRALGEDVKKLPVAVYTDLRDNGEQHRFFIWGYFDESVGDRDKAYALGQFPRDLSPELRTHVLLETDAASGRLIRAVLDDGVNGETKTDKKRDWASATALLKRLLPAGSHTLRVQDTGGENRTWITADPVINGIPVFWESEREDEGTYTISVNPLDGSIKEVSLGLPARANVRYPSPAAAVSEQKAVQSLLASYPLELVYVRGDRPHTDGQTWQLAYDLSFRQSRSHCYCGGEAKVDLTVYVDGQTGTVVVQE